MVTNRTELGHTPNELHGLWSGLIYHFSCHVIEVYQSSLMRVYFYESNNSVEHYILEKTQMHSKVPINEERITDIFHWMFYFPVIWVSLGQENILKTRLQFKLAYNLLLLVICKAKRPL